MVETPPPLSSRSITVGLPPTHTSSAQRLIAAVGRSLAKHRGTILLIQWLVVIFYLVLVIVPAFMPLPTSEQHIWNNLRLFAQFAFWGVWWPGVMLATMTLGRVWCGLLCPEGSLTEWTSRFGLGKPVPRWLKWPGWPFLAFVITTVYGQLVSVYEYPQASLLILGGSSLAAIGLALFYGRNKRIWCRYLCPASGVFAVLAKVAPFHYQVDRKQWQLHPIPDSAPVNCAPLVDIRRMTSAAECHSCGRCAGHRQAVDLQWRAPGAELANPQTQVTSSEALTLIFGLLGIATMAFQWSVSPWFVAMKIQIATWLVDHHSMLLLQDNSPWWLLTHYPQAQDVFTWLDGLLILGYILIGGGLLGALCLLAPWLGAKLLSERQYSWQRLSLTLAPLGGISVFLGLSMLTLSHLKAEHLMVPGVLAIRITLFVFATLLCLWLQDQLLRTSRATAATRHQVQVLMLWPIVVMALVWWRVFVVWGAG